MKKYFPIILSILYAFLLANLLRFLNTQHTFDFIHHQGYVISFIVIFILTSYLWKFSLKHAVLFTFSIILYEAANYVKAFNDMMINERSIMQTLLVGALFFGIFSTSFYISRFIKNKIIRYFVVMFALLFALLSVFPPMIALGYCAVSGGKMLSPDIVLTLFQTNAAEVMAYLHEQNILIWIVSSIALVVIISFYLFEVTRLKMKGEGKPFVKLSIALSVFLCYLFFHDLPKSTLNSIVHMVQSVKVTLASFEAFNATREMRLARLDELKKHVRNHDDGVYMVIMGESTTRDHMHAYGYQRENTPWLDEMAQNPNAFLFSNAYSNHVHTIPAVTYALTEQNQYTNIELEKAYSLMDIAQVAGFETYWISNQKKYSVSNTPVVTMASAADHEVFLNDYIGNKSITTYYDEKLAERIPDLKDKNKAFIIVHLMGCHAVYADRYESAYAQYDEGNFRVDSYDNCILYNDYVLSKLYDQIKDHPNFMAWFYVSDHGEDPDKGLTHESSKFTYQMSHIPFVVIVSDKFRAQNPEAYAQLKKNEKSYWSSDLLYNLVTDVLNLEGLPRVQENYSIASDKYQFKKEDILTLHGQKNIMADIQ